MKLVYLLPLASTIAFTFTSCSSSDIILSPIANSVQKKGYNRDNSPWLQSEKKKSAVIAMAYLRPFEDDGQMNLSLEVYNLSRTRSLTINDGSIQCFVNGKKVNILTKDKKLAHIRKLTRKNSRGQFGKKLGAAFVANLSNTHTVSSSYSGYVGRSYYSGTATSSHTNMAGAVADNMRYNSQIEREYAQKRSRTQYLKQHYTRVYFTPRTLRPKSGCGFLITPVMSNRKSKIRIEITLADEAHQLNFELE